jgi:hypothetical protein
VNESETMVEANGESCATRVASAAASLGCPPAMSIFALPEELLERIVDFMYADHAALHALACAYRASGSSSAS